MILLAIFLRFILLSQAKSTDPYIRCYGQLLGYAANSWPQGYSREQYTDNLNLCSALSGKKDENGHSKNVGCLCSTSFGRLTCQEDVADSNLWNHVITTDGPGYRNWREYCHESCTCEGGQFITDAYLTTLAAVEEGQANRIPSVSSLTTISELPEEGFEPLQQDSEDSEDSSSDSGSSSSDDTDAPGINLVVSNVSVVPGQATQPNLVLMSQDNITQFSPEQYAPDANYTESPYDGFDDPNVRQVCGVTCTTNADCGANGCTCHVNKSQYIPSLGTVLYEVGCGLRLRKRDSPRACACNETYVSHACCGSREGLVWEAAQHKLGEVATAERMQELLR